MKIINKNTSIPGNASAGSNNANRMKGENKIKLKALTLSERQSLRISTYSYLLP